MKRYLSTQWVGCGVLLLLGGCSSSPEFLQSAAQTARAAQHFDSLDLAVRRENQDEILKYTNIFLQEGYAGFIVTAAQSLAKRGDAIILNTIGWTWADNGRRTEHYQAAEILTRRAIELASEKIEDARQRNLHRVVKAWREQRAITLDSLAWALFKQQHFDEALQEQKKAVLEARETSDKLESIAELYFHLGEIYAALGQKEQALQAYKNALRDSPNYEPAKQALEKMKAKAAL